MHGKLHLYLTNRLHCVTFGLKLRNHFSFLGTTILMYCCVVANVKEMVDGAIICKKCALLFFLVLETLIILSSWNCII